MRIDEIYLSVQGEGPRVGIPTVFIRTGGCNLRCPGWPCDTLHAVLPENRHDWKRMEPAQVVKEFVKLRNGNHAVNACITGGEPFLQKDGELEELVNLLCSQSIVRNQAVTVECFSNGTLEYPAWALDLVYFIMDWKLPGSGEDPYNKMRLVNLANLSEGDAVKFVIADREDYLVAQQLWLDYIVAIKSPVEVYYGVAWDRMTDATLIKWVLEDNLPWRHNMQVHNYIWDRRKRGI